MSGNHVIALCSEPQTVDKSLEEESVARQHHERVWKMIHRDRIGAVILLLLLVSTLIAICATCELTRVGYGHVDQRKMRT